MLVENITFEDAIQFLKYPKKITNDIYIHIAMSDIIFSWKIRSTYRRVDFF